MASRYEVHIPLGGTGSGPPPSIDDHFAPKYIVGNVLAGDPAVAQAAPFVYIPDPGDGSGIAAAFTAAAVTPGDVWIRPGVYDLRIGAVASLTAPPSTLVRGAGVGSTIIIGRATGNQTVLSLGASSSLRDLQVASPPPTGATAGANAGVVQGGLASQVRDCIISMVRSVTVNRSQRIGINFPAVNGRELVQDCRLLIDSCNAQATPAFSQAIVFGELTTGFPSIVTDPEVRDTVIDEATSGAGSAVSAVSFQNVSGGRSYNVEHCNARTPFGSQSWIWVFSVPGDPSLLVRGPQFINCRMLAVDDQTSDNLGVLVAVAGTPNILGVTDMLITECRMIFPIAAQPVAGTDLIGYRIANSAEDSTGLFFGEISDSVSRFAVRGFIIDASGASTVGSIGDIQITACQESTTAGGHTTTRRGLRIRGNSSGQSPNVNNISVTNCCFRPDGGTAVGIEIVDASVSDTIVVANNLRAHGGGTPVGFVDNGVSTQSGLNIV